MNFPLRIISGLTLCAMGGALLSACGGGDGASADAESGSDEAYVAAFCEATATFGAAVISAIETLLTDDDDETAAKALAGPVEAFAAELKKAKPPKDVKSAHEAILSQLTRAVKDLKAGKNPADISDPSALPDLDEAVSARLNAVAAKDQVCVDEGVDFSEAE